MTRRIVLIVLATVAMSGRATAQEAPTASSVVEILARHDRGLIDDMKAYIAAKPDAEDVEQAYMLLFEKAIENDWFLEVEDEAKGYLERAQDGAVSPLARIIRTMARADAGAFDDALSQYESLMSGLGEADQEEFAANFADSLARKATAAGEVATAKRVYEVLTSRFGDSPTLRQRVEDELARLDRVGKPSPQLIATDLSGKTVDLSDLRGKVVLVDFWATWCSPCLAELPNLKAAYEKYHDRGFEIVGVSLDESVGPLADFVRTREIPWRQIHSGTSTGDPVAAYGITSIPASFLIGPDGTIVRLDPKGEDLDEVLEALMRD